MIRRLKALQNVQFLLKLNRKIIRVSPIFKWLYGQVRTYFFPLFIITIMSAFLSLSRVAFAFLSKDLVDAAVNSRWQKVITTCIYFTLAVFMQIILKGIISILSVRTSETMSNQVRSRIYNHLLYVKWSQYSGHHTGDILTRMTSDVSIVVGGVVSEIPELISQGVGLFASFIILYIFDPVLALFAICLGPVAFVVSIIFGSRFMRIHQRAQESESKFRSYMQECMQHMLILKTFCYEMESRKQFIGFQEKKKELVMKKNLATVITSSVVTGGFWLSYLLAFGWSALRLYQGSITFGTLTAFLQLISQVQSPFLGLASTLPQLVSTAASAERLMELEKLELEPRWEVKSNNKSDGTYDFNPLYIKINNLSFEYTQNAPVLSNITTTINPGEMVGLVGKSGEGKTTLIHLIMRLLEPILGDISYNDSQEHSYEEESSIRSLISYVPQGNTLFSGTIAYNLMIGCPNATKEDQINALKGADAWDFVNKLPNGLDTIIGERGLGLSEGQSQRISIARALLRKKPLLLLDEATSALDAETEKRVLQSILDLEPRPSCVLITHRPSMLEYCTRVWKIEGGELVERFDCVSEIAASNE